MLSFDGSCHVLGGSRDFLLRPMDIIFLQV